MILRTRSQLECSSEVECLPSMGKAQGSIPSIKWGWGGWGVNSAF